VSEPARRSDAFVERAFQFHVEGHDREVRLRVSAPDRDPRPGGRWRCRVEIAGFGRDVDQYAYGEDGLQALVLGLEMARVRLRTTPLPSGASLTWLGDAALGIPVMLPGSPVQ